MSERGLYLGRVEGVFNAGPRGLIAHLRPCFEAAPDMSSWRPVADAKEEFPNRGLVTWFSPIADAARGTLWQFWVEEQPSYRADNPKHDQFRLAQMPDPVREVLEVSEDADPEMTRRLLTEEGLFLPFTPSRQVYLWIDEGTWVGPVHLAQTEDGCWMLDPQEREVPLRCIRPVTVDRLHIDGQRLILAPAAKVGQIIGHIDWAPDEILLKRTLRWLRKTDRAYTDAIGLTDKAIEHAVELLNDAGLSRIEHSLELQRLRRSRDIVAGLTERKELSEGLIEDLLQVPPIQASVREVANRVRQETEAKVHIELQGLNIQVRELQVEKARLEEEIANLGATLSNNVDELEATVAARLAGLLERPGQALTDLAVLRAALGVTAGGQTVRAKLTPVSVKAGDGARGLNQIPQLPPSTVRGEATHLTDQAQLRQALRKSFRAKGAPSQVARMLHTAFLAGAMPLLTGSGAFRALEAYSQCVTGGRLLWLPIMPSMLEPSDLLGRVDAGAGRFVPAPGGLVDLLLLARESDALYLVVLDGLNRAAVDSYLYPILACYGDAWLGDRRRELPLLHPDAVAADDPYVSAAWLSWPRNVLLAGTFIDGATTVPIPSSFWNSATLIHLDTFSTAVGDVTADTGSEGPGSTGLPLTAVSLEVWRTWREKVQASAMAPEGSDLLAAIQESGIGLSAEIRALAAHMCAAERMWGPAAGNAGQGEDGRALESVVLQSLVPLAATVGKTEVLFEALSRAGPVTEQVERTAGLAREALS